MQIDIGKISKLKSEKIGFFRFKKFDDDNFLITNDIGKYAFLTNDQFSEFISGNLDSGEKYDELLNKDFIKSDGYVQKMASEYSFKNHFIGQGPTLHIMVVTLRCNHKCLYCHASAGNENSFGLDMSLDTAKKALETMFYSSSNNLTIEFQGGEPLLNWEVVKFFVENARMRASFFGKNLNFALVTNLTLMDEDKMNFLIENGVNISTSLDGDELLHNENRVFKNGNSFEKVAYWIKRFNEEYEKRGILNIVGDFNKVGALLTVTKNSLDKYKEIIDTYISLGVDGIFLRMLNPYGFAHSDISNLSYSPEEFGEFYKNSLNYILELNKSGVDFREQLSCIYLAKIMNERDPNYLDERSPCGACIGQLAYYYNGKVYTCDEGRMLGRMGIDDFCVAELSENAQKTYGEIMNSEITKTMVQASTIDGLPGYNDDVYKPYLGICPIYNFKQTGNIFSSYSKDKRRIIENMVLDYLFSNLRIPENKEIFEKWLGKSNPDSDVCK